MGFSGRLGRGRRVDSPLITPAKMLKVRAANPMRTNVVNTIPPVFPEARSAFSSGGRGPRVYQIRGKEVTSLRGVVAVAHPDCYKIWREESAILKHRPAV